MNRWSIFAPYARLVFGGPLGDEGLAQFLVELARLPGVKERAHQWEVPYNAMRVVQGLLDAHPTVRLASASWASSPPALRTWTDVESKLRAGGEVRSWVLDGFLTDYQKEAIAYGWGRSGVHYWHSPGAGKTLSGLLTALSRPGPVVVVTLASLRLQYAGEIERFLHAEAFVIRPASLAKGKVRVRGESWNEFRARHKGQGLSTQEMGKLWRKHQEDVGVDPPRSMQDYVRETKHRPFIVVAWEALVDHLDELVRLRPGVVIFDESDVGKSSKRYNVVHLGDLPFDSVKAKEQHEKETAEAKSRGGFIKETEDGRKMFLPVMNRAAAGAHLARATRMRICTTATPVRDRIRDLWSQLDLCEPNAWGNASTWKLRYADAKPGHYGGWDDRGASRIEELKQRLDTVAHVLSYSETHGQLPPKRRQSLYIAPEDQCAPAAGFTEEMKVARRLGPGAVFEVRLAMAASGKRKAVLDTIGVHLDAGQKVVAFTGRKRDCNELGTLVRKRSKGARVWVAHGDDPADARQSIVKEYMADPGPCILVGTGHAFGTGLNLDTADAVLFVMLPYTPGQLRQWEGRFSRQSSTKPVLIYYAIAEGTVDERLASILLDKLPAVEMVVEDEELGGVSRVLSGFDATESEESFVQSILDLLDYDEDDE